MEVQVSLLQEHLAEPELDAVGIVERAETIYLYAQCLRDFPELPEMLRTQFPRPPECFEAFLPADPPKDF
jgi:hypothetical protein